MNQVVLIEKYNYVCRVNKALGVVLVLAIVLSGMLSVMLYSSLGSSRTIIIPPNVSEPFSTYNGIISKSGLIDQSKYITHLFLDITPSNVLAQHERLLGYVSSKDYTKVKEMLIATSEKIKSLGVSSSFRVHKVSVNEKQQTVVVSGEQTLYQGEAVKGTVSKKYRLKFANILGRHSLIQLEELEND